jgi:hypothetical protein
LRAVTLPLVDGEFAGEARGDETGGDGEGGKSRQRLAQGLQHLRAIDSAASLKSAARVMAVMRA